ncbi:hypothetical protein EVAR_101652_1 [Eumeta japonica]|uniref:Uncharacterized protein n=1 Tax=Eumeta variegata TaxID=151549 RepID=A0A4C1TGW0_EUMVA|nr:hypothetical protein EVAR_101652_1 [Eumeta japonica]
MQTSLESDTRLDLAAVRERRDARPAAPAMLLKTIMNRNTPFATECYEIKGASFLCRERITRSISAEGKGLRILEI